jgi:hypothetical protein
LLKVFHGYARLARAADHVDSEQRRGGRVLKTPNSTLSSIFTELRAEVGRTLNGYFSGESAMQQGGHVKLTIRQLASLDWIRSELLHPLLEHLGEGVIASTGSRRLVAGEKACSLSWTSAREVSVRPTCCITSLVGSPS